MKKKQIVGLIVAAVLFIVVGAASVLTNTFSQKKLNEVAGSLLAGDFEFNAPFSDYIAIVNVEGTIQEQTAEDMFNVQEGYHILLPCNIWTS